MHPQDYQDHRRAFVAIFLAAALLFIWQTMVEAPRRKALSQYTVQQAQQRIAEQNKRADTLSIKSTTDAEDNPNLTRAERLATSPRILLKSDKLHGSISLKGARFDDITLARYHVTQTPGSPEVTLFNPAGEKDAYFAQAGWLSNDGTTKIPDSNTLWQADKTTLAAGEQVTLRWNNGEGVLYTIIISLDEDYMFGIRQQVSNQSGREISVTPYAYINRKHEDLNEFNAILHEGSLGVANNALSEVSYKELRDKGNHSLEGNASWLGFTDKYWLSALIPGEGQNKTTFSYYVKNDHARYQTDYMAEAQTLAPNATADYSMRLFAGAKEVNILDRYAAGDSAKQLPPVPLFDRSVDFGSLYFLTKPLFLTLNFFYSHIGNFGLAIMLLTILVKIIMYPLANKAYHATSQMRELQPEIAKLRERHQGDHMALQKATMELYKREKVNPASGCLPLLIQLPVFFALYKVLFVTIEMRHAPFLGWITDLSAADPSNIFTAFGLLHWNTPNFLHLGVLPIVYCITMVIQMKQQPKPADEMQAKVMSYMPYFFLLIFAKMPAGLLVYWIWSNIISIVQQRIISERHHAYKEKLKAKAM